MLEDICINLDTAKKLVEAGVVIESCFYWIMRNDETEHHLSDSWDDYDCRSVIPAPTAEEINRQYFSQRFETKIHFHYFEGRCMAELFNLDPEHQGYFKTQWYEKLCEVYAEMLLWLKTEGYLV